LSCFKNTTLMLYSLHTLTALHLNSKHCSSY
jgi:hypothetical protein